MSRSQRRAMIDREEPKLSLVRQCALLGISRSSLYYLPTEAGAEDLELMALIDQQYLKTPFYGSRRMTAWLRNHGHQVNRKRVHRLMQLIGLEAIYRRPNTSKPNPGHKVYPYLLRGLEINRVNQVWATDITYIPMARGFLYLVAIRSRPVKWCKSASSCCCCLGGCRLREIGLRKSFVEGQNGGCEVSTSDDPFVVLLSQDGANEAAHGRPVREDCPPHRCVAGSPC